MARYSGKRQVSDETRAAAMKIARGTQTPGQTKAQTRLIAQGIERGIDRYKKEQKDKARAEDRRRRATPPRAAPTAAGGDGDAAAAAAGPRRAGRWLPWLLLALTWAGIAVHWLSARA